MKSKSTFTKHQEEYTGTFYTEDDYETFTIAKNLEHPGIKLSIFEARWRTPRETITYLQELTRVIQENFL